MQAVYTEVNVQGETKPRRVYYLTEEGYASFKDIKDRSLKMFYDLSSCQSRINILQEENDILRGLLREPLVQFFKTKYVEALKDCEPTKSFREHKVKLVVSYRFAEEKSEAFAQLVKERFITDRGSGWYRINKEA